MVTMVVNGSNFSTGAKKDMKAAVKTKVWDRGDTFCSSNYGRRLS